jgi:hypothetical protein
MTVCYGNITILMDKTLAIFDLYGQMLFEDGVLSTYKVLKSVDPIIFSCYFSLFEYYTGMNLYVSTLTDWHKLLFNLTHNLGNIYDLIEESVFRFKTSEDYVRRLFFWDRLGFLLGSLLHDVLEDPTEYYPYDPSKPRDL